MSNNILKDLALYFSKTDQYEPGLGNLADSDEKNIHHRNAIITNVVKEFETEYRQSNKQRNSYRRAFRTDQFLENKKGL